MRDILRQGFAAMGLSVSPAALEQLEQYASLLLEKNQVMNLTAITQPEQVARLHFLDSAAVLVYGNDPPPSSPPLPSSDGARSGPSWLSGKRLLDVGTGAGFPGLVLKILEPSLDLALIDSLGKRLDWLGEVCQRLRLNGVQRFHVRAEEQALLPGFRDSFDVVTSRAVASLPQLTELCLPFVRVGGSLIALKSANCDEEVSSAQNALRCLGGEGFRLLDYQVPGTETVHRLVLARKRSSTPKGYPRTWGKIKRQPL